MIYRVAFRKIIEVNFADIKIKRDEYFRDFYEKELNIQNDIVDDILNNPENYRFINCIFNVKNTSNKLRIVGLKIEPNFTKDLKEIILWYDKNPGVAPIVIEPLKEREIKMQIFIKFNNLNNNDIEKMLSESHFKVSGITGNSIFNIGYDSIIIKYQN